MPRFNLVVQDSVGIMVTDNHDRESERFAPASAKLAGDTGADPLSDVLDAIRLRGALFFLWRPAREFGVGVANGASLSRHIVPGTDRVISYHIVERGPCWATVHGEAPLRLESGDILVLPRGDAYRIGDTPQFPTDADTRGSIEFFRSMSAGEMPPVVADPGADADCNRLICGFLGCDLPPRNPLLATLPRMIRVPAPPDGIDPLTHLIEFAVSESAQNRGGERCLLMRLSEVMFVEVLRRYLRSEAATESGWINGLRDPVVANALALLHRDPGHSWTLPELAHGAGASRSILAQRFRQTVGVPPMQYLAEWRMQLAAARLADHAVKVYSVANEVGYASEAAFSRAFKRIVGMSPKAWRYRHLARQEKTP